MKTKVGNVTVQERDEIRSLYERKNGLKELFQVVNADNVELYERLVTDMGETSSMFQKWWDDMSDKYQWQSSINGNWEINFDTCDIYLVDNECSCKK